jgi:hypothetical protein
LGLNFSGRSRTLITQLHKSDEELAKEVATFLNEARKQLRSNVPSWNQVVDDILKNCITYKKIKYTTKNQFLK